MNRSTTAGVAAMATAASTALPPAWSVSRLAWVASGWFEATARRRPMIRLAGDVERRPPGAWARITEHVHADLDRGRVGLQRVGEGLDRLREAAQRRRLWRAGPGERTENLPQIVGRRSPALHHDLLSPRHAPGMEAGVRVRF